VRRIKHLFIINPVADKVKGRVDAVTHWILDFFKGYPHLNYDIHITRWDRDALGVIRRYAEKTDELMRVHVMGGSGLLFEAVNGVVGLPNTHIAVYPFGRHNEFLKQFAKDTEPFSSLRSQVFSGTVPVDLIKCESFYGIVSLAVGFEAVAYKHLSDKEHGSAFAEAVKLLLRGKEINRNYFVSLDGKNLDGEYSSFKAVNLLSRRDDGYIDVYSVKRMPRLALFAILNNLLSENYRKLNMFVTHYRGRNFSLSSGKVSALNLDGQILYEKDIECEVLPCAVEVVNPGRES